MIHLAKEHTNKGQEFSEDRIYNRVKMFSFPRLAGTDGEVKAVNLTVETFKEIGFTSDQIEKQHFIFSDFYSTTLIKLIMILNLTFNLMLVLFVYIHIYFSIFLITGNAIVVYSIIKGVKNPKKDFWGRYFGDEFNATNVFIKIPAKSLNEARAGNIVLSAHLDSKSQTFKNAWLVIHSRLHTK